MKNNQWIWMVIGYGLPLLFIFLAPSLGFGDGSSLFIFIIFIFAIHLFMLHGSHGNSGHNHSQHKETDSKKSKEIASIGSKEEHKGHHH